MKIRERCLLGKRLMVSFQHEFKFKQLFISPEPKTSSRKQNHLLTLIIFSVTKHNEEYLVQPSSARAEVELEDGASFQKRRENKGGEGRRVVGSCWVTAANTFSSPTPERNMNTTPAARKRSGF